MEIAILSYRRKLRDELEAQLRICLGDCAQHRIKQFSLGYAPPDNTAAAFIIIDGERALHIASSAANLGGKFPVAMAATHPRYALSGTRLNVKHYILYPLEPKNIRETLLQMGVPI